MVHNDEDDNGMENLTGKEVMRIVMQEVVDIRRELKDDIATLDRKFDIFTQEVRNIGYKLDQNTVALMANINDHERRITKLEVAAA